MPLGSPHCLLLGLGVEQKLMYGLIPPAFGKDLSSKKAVESPTTEELKRSDYIKV